MSGPGAITHEVERKSSRGETKTDRAEKFTNDERSPIKYTNAYDNDLRAKVIFQPFCMRSLMFDKHVI